MKTQLLHIKNMVCPRCIEAVVDVFRQLSIESESVELGRVAIRKPLSIDQKNNLQAKLSNRGFELLEDYPSVVVAKVKAAVIQQIHARDKKLAHNFSTHLEEKLNRDYNSLSKIFSEKAGYTIERFIIRQKIEKIKELISYDELSLSEVSEQLGYSSLAHLSAQFKKETGMTPTAYRKLENKSRNSLDLV